LPGIDLFLGNHIFVGQEDIASENEDIAKNRKNKMDFVLDVKREDASVGGSSSGGGNSTVFAGDNNDANAQEWNGGQNKYVIISKFNCRAILILRGGLSLPRSWLPFFTSDAQHHSTNTHLHLITCSLPMILLYKDEMEHISLASDSYFYVEITISKHIDGMYMSNAIFM
ncbi:hypothetical protein ACJX0J_028164, partial [Zea mays]